MKKRVLMIALVFFMVADMLPAVLRAADSGTIELEGENYSTANFTPPIQSNVVYSGGKTVFLYSTTNAPEEGYIIRYTFDVKHVGTYQLDISASPPQVVWASPYDLQVNDSDFVRVPSVKQYANVNSLVRKYHLQTVSLHSGSNTISFRVTERRTNPADNKYTFLLDSLVLTQVPLELVSIKTDGPLNVMEDGVPVNLYVNMNMPVVEDVQVDYKISDYWSRTIAEETITVPQGQDTATIAAGLVERGNYRVDATVQETGQTVKSSFAVVVPLAEREQMDDSPFGLDVGEAEFLPDAMSDDYARIIELSGVKWARERFYWPKVNSQPGEFDFAFYKDYFQSLHDHGIKISAVYAASPPFTRQPNKKLPEDLLAAYQFALNASDYYGVDNWEIWNEPDVLFTTSDESPDQYAAFIKATALGYRDSQTTPLIATGGFAKAAGKYTNMVMQNEVLPYVDIYNMHGYPAYPYVTDQTNIVPFPEQLQQSHNDLMNTYSDAGTKNLWMTEAGLRIPITQPTDELTPEQEMLQARYLVTSTVTSISLGTDKHFWYLTHYDISPSGKNYFGMFSSADAPNASYSAEAAMTQALGRGEYEGQVSSLPDGVTGHLFWDRDSSVIVLWSETARSVELPIHTKSVEATDIMGRDLRLSAAKKTLNVPVGPDPVYVKVKGKLSGLAVKKQDKDANKAPVREPLTEAQRVVLSQKYSPEAEQNSKITGYQLNAVTPNMIQLEVYNFNDQPMMGKVEGIASAGWQFEQPVQDVTVQPFSKQIVKFEISAGSEVVPNVKSPIVFRGTFGNRETTDSVAWIRTKLQDIELDELIPGSDAPGSWQNNPNSIFEGDAPGSVVFDFQKSGFPYLQLPEGTDYTAYTGFSLKVSADSDLAGTRLSVRFIEKNGSNYAMDPEFTLKQGLNIIQLPFDELEQVSFLKQDSNNKLDLDQLDRVQILITSIMDDMPPLTVQDFGLYSGYQNHLAPQIESVYPSDGVVITNAKPDIMVAFRKTDVLIDPDSIEVELDGKKLPYDFDASDGRTLTIKSPHLKKGLHQLSVTAFDHSNAYVDWTSSFTVE